MHGRNSDIYISCALEIERFYIGLAIGSDWDGFLVADPRAIGLFE